MADNGQMVFNTSVSLQHHSLEMYNSSVTESVAERFVRVDEELQEVRTRIRNAYTKLDDAWNGDASEAFLTQFDRLWNQVNDFGDAFSNFVDLLKQANTKFREADSNFQQALLENAANSAKAQEDGKKNGQDSVNVPTGVVHSGMLPEEQNADLTYDPMKEKDHLQSTMEDIQKGDLSWQHQTEKDHLKSTMEAERNADLSYNPLQRVEQQKSTLGDRVDAQIDYQLQGEKDYLHSTMGDRSDAVLNDPGMPMKDYLHSTMEERADADLAYTPLVEKDYLSSTMGTPESAILDFEPMTMKDYLSSAMEEAIPGISTSELYSSLLINQFGEREIGPRLADIFNNLDELMSHELEFTLLTPKEEVPTRLEEASQAVLGDYLKGSPVYREVMESLMALKVTKTMTDALLSGVPMEQAEQMVGQTVLDALIKNNGPLSTEMHDAFSKSIGHKLLTTLSPTDGNGQISSLITVNGDAWHNGQAQRAVADGIVSALDQYVPKLNAKPNIISADTLVQYNAGPQSVILENLHNGGNNRLDINHLQVNVTFNGSTNINADNLNQILATHEQNMKATSQITGALNSLNVPANEWAGQVLDGAEQKVSGNTIIMSAPPVQDFSAALTGEQSEASINTLLDAVNKLRSNTIV